MLTNKITTNSNSKINYSFLHGGGGGGGGFASFGLISAFILLTMPMQKLAPLLVLAL